METLVCMDDGSVSTSYLQIVLMSEHQTHARNSIGDCILHRLL